MNQHTRSAACCAVAMTAGGFTYSAVTLSPLAKAGLVGLVAAIVMAVMLYLLHPWKITSPHA